MPENHRASAGGWWVWLLVLLVLAVFEAAACSGLLALPVPLVALPVLLVAVTGAAWVGGIRMSFGRQGTRPLKVFFLLVLAVSLVAAYWLTYRFSYFASADTKVFGCPVPTVIFHRDAPGEPWLDYVGWTVVGAYPLNLLLLGAAVLGPSWVVHRVLRRKARPSDPSAGPPAREVRP